MKGWIIKVAQPFNQFLVIELKIGWLALSKISSKNFKKASSYLQLVLINAYDVQR